MGRRCETINNGQPCSYLAQDGTCLLDGGLLKEACPALEKVEYERKDEWLELQRLRNLSVSPYQGKE